MTCEEFERVLPEDEGGQTVECESHLNSCSACSGLVSDLNAISRQARLLQGAEEPNARVWNSIEIALRQEGLIRERKQMPFLVASRPARSRIAWLIPAAAVILLTFGVVQHERSTVQTSQQTPVRSTPTSEIADASGPDDQQLLEAVSRRTPAMRASYEANLRDVNSYIRDAEESVKIDPNDAQAQQYLMNAYEQKSMVYEIAMNRSLP
jgi:negative regulator of sigma E activity